MTYLAKPRIVTRSSIRPGMVAMGDFFDTALDAVIGGAAGIPLMLATEQAKSSGECVQNANGDPQVAQLDSRIDDLSKNWKPTGFYSPSEVETIHAEVIGLLMGASAQLLLAPHTTGDAATVIGMASSSLGSKIGDGAAFAKAAADARASGKTIVDAPGLRRWVLMSMTAVSQAMVTAGTLQCESSWLDSAMQTVLSLADHAWTVIKVIAGQVAKLGDVILKVPDILDTLLTFGKWAIILGGGAYVVNEIAKRRNGKPLFRLPARK